MLGVELAVHAFLDALGEVLGDLALEAAEHEGAELGAEAAAQGAGLPLGAVALALVGLGEVGLVAEVAGLAEVHDGPEVEHPVLEGGAGEGEAVVGVDLLDGDGDLGGGVLDELGLVEDDVVELGLPVADDVAAQRAVGGEDDVVIRQGRRFFDAGVAGVVEHPQRRGELACLLDPVEHQALGHDHQ